MIKKIIVHSKHFKFNYYKPSFMVEVFKTNEENHTDSEEILKTLKKKFPLLKINFNLGDCDKILQIEEKNISIEEVIRKMNLKEYKCQPL